MWPIEIPREWPSDRGPGLPMVESDHQKRPPRRIFMQAIAVRDREADGYGLSLIELASPHAAENDVVVEVHAAGFLRGEPEWPSTWTDRAGRDRTPSVLGHELSGVV